MKHCLAVVLSLALCVLSLLSFASCENEEPPIGGDLNSRDMTLSVVRVIHGGEEKDFTTNTRKRAILEIVNEVLAGEAYTENATVSDVPGEGEYALVFIYHITDSPEYRLTECRLTADTLVDLGTSRAYPITQAQRDDLVAILSLVPTPGQTL